MDEDNKTEIIPKRQCPQCNYVVDDLKFCSNCGYMLLSIEKRFHINSDYPFRTHGPKQTCWPPASRNLWNYTELTPNESTKLKNKNDLHIMWTPSLSLGSGEYEIVLTTNTDSGNKEFAIYLSNQDEPLGKLAPTAQCEVETSKNNLRFSLHDPVTIIQIGVGTELIDPPSDVCLLLIPRFGQIWFGDELSHREFDYEGDKKVYGHHSYKHSWSVQKADFRDDFLTFGPYIPLSPGDYIAHVRLSIANWDLEDHPIIAIDIFSSFEGQTPKFGTETIAKIEVYPKDIPQQGKTQDFACYFHLDTAVFEDKEPDTHRKIECRIRTLQPADVTIHHIRLSSPDDLISEKYYELGGVDSVLGPPLGYTFLASPSKEGTQGYLKRYHAGSIYWSPQFGTFETYGCCGFLYEKFGGTAKDLSNFGFPRTGIRKVVSSFSTVAYVQYYQGVWNKQSAAIYSLTLADNCLDNTFEVFGHIGYLYFQELGGHEGPLGFPMSGEHWASEEEKIRRNYFEGGFIEAIEVESGRWDKHQVIFYPRPILKVPSLPEFTYRGDPCTIRVEVDNHGGDADEGYLTLSFPDSNVENISINSDHGSYIISYIDDEIHWKYGSGQKIKVEYPRAELVIAPFKAGKSYWMDVTFTPTRIGASRLYLRCTAGIIPKYEKLNIHFEGDPSPVGSNPVDQQGEHVYEYSIGVVEKPFSDLKIVDILAPPLVKNRFDFITVVIENIGTGIAKDITIILDDLLTSRRSNLKIQSLDPDERHPVNINISPSASGDVELQFLLTYLDQFDQSHDHEFSRRYIIHENSDQMFQFDSFNVGLPEDLFTQIGNAFIECDEFQSDRSLRAIFVINEISPFRNELQEAPNIKSRITGLISYLFPKHATNGENALVIFCRVLGKRYKENDQRRHNLIRLADELSDYLSNNQP